MHLGYNNKLAENKLVKIFSLNFTFEKCLNSGIWPKNSEIKKNLDFGI